MRLLAVALLVPCAVVAGTLYAVHREESAAPDGRSLAEATAEMDRYRVDLEREAGRPVESWEEHPEPCERTKMTTPKKEPWFLAGSGELTVEPADQPAVLAGLRRWWQSRGYEIVTSEHGRLVATDPGTGAGTTLWTVERPDIVYVHVKSACMRPAEGEDPGYEGI